MTAIRSTDSATPSLQALMTKARLEQAKQDAQTAQDSLTALDAEVQEADQALWGKRQTVRDLSMTVWVNDTTYTGQLRASRSAVPPATQDFLIRMYSGASAQFSANGNPLKANPRSQPFINYQGEVTGRILNQRA